jgi:hypothetical protein
MKFANDNEFLQFAAEFLKSKHWEWLEEIATWRRKKIMEELNNPRTTADGRAMLTGRLLENNYFITFIEGSYSFHKGQMEAAKAEAKDKDISTRDKDDLIKMVGFPDLNVVTH